jgi:hypothetical protein
MLDKRKPFGFPYLDKSSALKIGGVREKKRVGKPLVKCGVYKLRGI